MITEQSIDKATPDERFLLDKSDCVEGGDMCKAEMRRSIAGAYIYHSALSQLRTENIVLREACEAALPQLAYMRRRGLIPPEFRSHADNVIKQVRAALEVKNG